MLSAGILASTISVVASSQAQTEPPAKKADDLPPGPGKETFVHSCSTCHATNTVTAQKKTADARDETVNQMRNRGADVSDADQKLIVQYLAANFGAKQADSAPDSTPPK